MEDAKTLGEVDPLAEDETTVDGGSREDVRILVFSASTRAGSLNTRLALLAASVIDEEGGHVDLASMADFDCPSYDGDVQEGEASPS